jgi:hypothetical protein
MSYQTRNAERAKAHDFNTPQWQINRDTERGPVLNPDGGHFSTMGALRGICEINNRELDYCSHYGEPGYTEPATGILFANWNDVSKRLQDRLSAQGYELEWSDEWYIDYDHSKAYRTSPDSYGWESQLMFSEGAGDYLTPDDNASEWIAECENNPRTALPSWIDAADLEAAGYERANEIYESGFFPGQNDEPEKIAVKLESAGKEYVFQITHVQQFDIRFHVWIKSDAPIVDQQFRSDTMRRVREARK